MLLHRAVDDRLLGLLHSMQPELKLPESHCLLRLFTALCVVRASRSAQLRCFAPAARRTAREVGLPLSSFVRCCVALTGTMSLNCFCIVYRRTD